MTAWGTCYLDRRGRASYPSATGGLAGGGAMPSCVRQAGGSEASAVPAMASSIVGGGAPGPDELQALVLPR